MRKLLLFFWLLIPVAVMAYHYGPGQDRLREDDAAEAIAIADGAFARATTLEREKDVAGARELFSEAEEAYGRAIAALPVDRVAELRMLRLSRCKAQMAVSKLPEARRELESLVEELAHDAKSDDAFIDDAQRTLAQAKYYTTWLLRLEGLSREEWLPEIESARQIHRLLAEKAEKARDANSAKLAREDLEASVRLERMSLSDLQGLPLPSQ